MRGNRRLWATSLLVFAAGCGRCAGMGGGRNADELVSPDATFVVTVPDLGALADKSQGLLATARAGAGGGELVAASANLARELGFDPLTRDGQKAAGLSSKGSLALAGAPVGREGGLAVLPAADLPTLEATVDRLAKDHLGAGVKETRTADGRSMTVLAKTAGGVPVFAYAPRDGLLLLGAGPEATELVSKALVVTAEQSIAKSPLFSAARSKVGAKDLYVFLPKSGSRRLKVVPDVLAAGVALSAKEVTLRAYVALPELRQQAAAGTLVGGGADELSRLPAGEPFYLRGGVDWKALVAFAEQDPRTKSSLDEARGEAKAAGIDLDDELVNNVAPEFAVTVGLSPDATLQSAFDFDPRRANPFRAYSVVALAKVRDAKKAAATLEKLVPVIEKDGTTVDARDFHGQKLYTANYRLGQGLSWTLVGDDLVLAGGLEDKLTPTLEKLRGKEDAVKPDDFAPDARTLLFGHPGLAAALDFARLGETVKALPNDAFGTGPQAYMARSMVNGVVEPLSRLKAVAGIAPTDGGVLVDLSVATK